MSPVKMSKEDQIKYGLAPVIVSSNPAQLTTKFCMLCQDDTIGYFDIARHFCSDFEKIKQNICKDHKRLFAQKMAEFFDKK
jgi:hypothetical protein